MTPYYAADGVTLYLGDSQQITEWLDADVLVTDPPYGMGYVSGYTPTRRPIHNDHDSAARDRALADWGDRPALVFGTWRVPRPTRTRQVIVWHKATVGPGMGDLSIPWGNATEEIYVIGEGWTGRRRPNIITTTDPRGSPYGAAARLGHPTPKPVGLIEQLIECCPPGVIADPFAGAGSTLLAARGQGRKAIGVEIREDYCATAVKRLAQGVLFGEMS